MGVLISWYSNPGGIFTSGTAAPPPPPAAPISRSCHGLTALCIDRAETDVLVGCINKNSRMY